MILVKLVGGTAVATNYTNGSARSQLLCQNRIEDSSPKLEWTPPIKLGANLVRDFHKGKHRDFWRPARRVCHLLYLQLLNTPGCTINLQIIFS